MHVKSLTGDSPFPARGFSLNLPIQNASEIAGTFICAIGGDIQHPSTSVLHRNMDFKS
jgi:hypothetical protein